MNSQSKSVLGDSPPVLPRGLQGRAGDGLERNDVGVALTQTAGRFTGHDFLLHPAS
ncbi:hypothetical protein SMD44_p10224 (plasmid) [Streptomyces alboflavus]|uniref:Uncharacterized protein n=1 Tax=Streptomyces alboflavus TaxID=67267 RepID=A0A291W492_9ACTN|nr:hypothetical protein SMD44_p10224 [Streptomyces alboflavus]